jgi:undecaprenyl diphosphate synthase
MIDRGESSPRPSLDVRPSRVPRHVGLIPDGNRRWARARGLPAHEGYAAGIEPGLELVDVCRRLGIEELSVYGFTKENVRRPSAQVDAFRRAVEDFGCRIAQRGAAVLAVGDSESRSFPERLREFTKRSAGDIRVNLLVNYGWRWDLQRALAREPRASAKEDPLRRLGSRDVSRIDLVVRWGGRLRLSGFLPMQCAYADVRSVETLWPDVQPEELLEALRWYASQDVTLGG